MEATTRFVERLLPGQPVITPYIQAGGPVTIDGIYTPNESLGVIKVNGQRVCNLFWEDDVRGGQITRRIEFEWYKEPDKEVDLFNQK